MRDDILDEENPDVKEALRRLPKHLVDERNFRICRAMQIDTNRRVLPEEQWTKYEEVSNCCLIDTQIKLVHSLLTEREYFCRM